MEGTLPSPFHALFDWGSPKYTPSSWFCSRTVHTSAKPKPLRNQSMASKPWMVRRAVWNEEAADSGHVLLDPEVVAFYVLLQMFGNVVGWHAR